MAMSALFPQKSLEAYVGDTETGVVHRYRVGCPNVEGAFFLDVRTALVHGYRLCTCCGARNESASA